MKENDEGKEGLLNVLHRTLADCTLAIHDLTDGDKLSFDADELRQLSEPFRLGCAALDAISRVERDEPIPADTLEEVLNGFDYPR
jgi:hypothetical protein